MEKEIVSIMILFIVISISGCIKNEPYFKGESLKAEPTFLKPDDTRYESLLIHYTLRNPTNLDFSGKVSYKFDNNCMNLRDDETEVSIPIHDDITYSIDVSSKRNTPEDCFGTQQLLLILSNAEGTIVYDSASVDISISK